MAALGFRNAFFVLSSAFPKAAVASGDLSANTSITKNNRWGHPLSVLFQHVLRKITECLIRQKKSKETYKGMLPIGNSVIVGWGWYCLQFLFSCSCLQSQQPHFQQDPNLALFNSFPLSIRGNLPFQLALQWLKYLGDLCSDRSR